MNDSNYLKLLLRSSAILTFENDKKHCFFQSILSSLHRCNKNIPNRVSIYRQYFIEINKQAFDFSDGFKYNYIHIFEKIKNLSINICETKFYQDQTE